MTCEYCGSELAPQRPMASEANGVIIQNPNRKRFCKDRCRALAWQQKRRDISEAEIERRFQQAKQRQAYERRVSA